MHVQNENQNLLRLSTIHKSQVDWIVDYINHSYIIVPVCIYRSTITYSTMRTLDTFQIDPNSHTTITCARHSVLWRHICAAEETGGCHDPSLESQGWSVVLAGARSEETNAVLRAIDYVICHSAYPCSLSSNVF